MFTGLIECAGTVTDVTAGNESMVLTIKPGAADFDVAVGASVAINGVCLTVTHSASAFFAVTAVSETLSRTSFAKTRAGTIVNLERALRLSDRLDGHIVTGHVDGVGRILDDERIGDSLVRTIGVPQELMKFCAEKGSIALDGISLTIASSHSQSISVALIPHTIARTTMGHKAAGDSVNIECDIVARYIFQLFASRSDHLPCRTSLLDLMEKAGF